MTAVHRPDCFLADPCTAPGPHQPIGDGSCWKCVYPCCCDRLSTCEQRTLDTARSAVYDRMMAWGYGQHIVDDVLDALDSQRTEPK